MLMVASLKTYRRPVTKILFASLNKKVQGSNGHNAVNVESESSPIRSAANGREDGPKADKTSQGINP